MIIIQSVKICKTCLVLLFHEELNSNARIKILSHLTLGIKKKTHGERFKVNLNLFLLRYSKHDKLSFEH